MKQPSFQVRWHGPRRGVARIDVLKWHGTVVAAAGCALDQGFPAFIARSAHGALLVSTRPSRAAPSSWIEDKF
jgi:hypothetical protein